MHCAGDLDGPQRYAATDIFVPGLDGDDNHANSICSDEAAILFVKVNICHSLVIGFYRVLNLCSWQFNHLLFLRCEALARFLAFLFFFLQFLGLVALLRPLIRLPVVSWVAMPFAFGPPDASSKISSRQSSDI
jgi:hypothetical protein